MLAFIDQIVIPFLASLYGAVGYLGVMLAMAIESAMIPRPSELILPFAGFLVSDPTKIEPLTNGPWSFWVVVLVATLGNTIGSLIAYAIGAWGGRPFLERYGKYLLIRPHEIEIAERFFARWGAQTAFFSRLLPIVRTFISFPAGVARRALQPFDFLIAVAVVVGLAALLWLRLGRPVPGRPRRSQSSAARPTTTATAIRKSNGWSARRISSQFFPSWTPAQTSAVDHRKAPAVE